MVKGDYLQPRGRGFESLCRILDRMQAKERNEIKVAKWGTPKIKKFDGAYPL